MTDTTKAVCMILPPQHLAVALLATPIAKSASKNAAHGCVTHSDQAGRDREGGGCMHHGSP